MKGLRHIRAIQKVHVVLLLPKLLSQLLFLPLLLFLLCLLQLWVVELQELLLLRLLRLRAAELLLLGRLHHCAVFLDLWPSSQ